MIGTDAFQEVDTYGLSIPVTKHNYLVRDAGELLCVVPEAFRIAKSGRPGPVLIDVPKDVQVQRLSFTGWPSPSGSPQRPGVDQTAIADAAAMINAAERPVLYLGGGVIHSGAGIAAVQLAEKASLPTTMTLMGLGAMPADHALSIGMLGMHAARYTNLVLEECDLLIAAGARFDDRATGKVKAFCRHAKIIHIDVDEAELNKIKAAHIGIVGDVGAVLSRMLPHVKAAPRLKWLGRMKELKGDFPLVMPGCDDVRSPYGLIRAVAGCSSDDVIITTDVGQHQMWVAQAYPLRRPRQLLTSGGLGTMGFGLPAAIGAALAEPSRRVICFTGDGSLLMNIQELATLAELNLDVKIVLMNNNALGLVHQQQTLFYGKRLFASNYAGTVDFVRIAEGFGIKAVDLAAQACPQAALHAALGAIGPMLIHAPIDADHMVLPMVPPGAANKEMIGATA